ncbi:putative PKS/NRPS-like protein biosynthetic cluster [Pleurotus pulmonarius]|nr:putative PKS/NRPS-like protein biosynthetic cluster [Pleurotus pulmonarius]
MRRVRPADGPFSDELRNFLLALGQLATLGINTIDLTSFYGRSLSCGFPIPYPFHPSPVPPPKTFSPPDTQIHSYTRPLSPPSFKINSDTHQLLAQHVVGGQSILPATAFIEMLLEGGATYLWDVEFHSFLPIHKTSTTENKVMRTHARGNMDSSSNKASPTPTPAELWDVLRPLHALDFYERACVVSAFGPSFRRVVRVSGGPTRALAEVEGPTHEERFSGYILHPATLDACLHFVLHPDISRQYTSNVNWLPSQIGSFELYTDKPEPGNWFSYAELVDWDPDHRTYNISVQGVSGNAICSFRSIVLRQQRSSLDAASQSYEIILQPTAITAQLCPLPTTFDIMYREEVQQLLAVLDSLALQILEDTLAQNPSTSNHLDRQRYRQFAENAIKSNSVPTIDPTAVAGVRRRWPTYFEVTERVRQHHNAIFTSPLAAVNALYSDDLMSRFYGPSSILNSVCLALVNHFRDIIASIKDSGKRVVRILEVGAGTGLLTRHLTEYLSTMKGLAIEYVVTDISLSFATDLAQKLPFKFLTPKAYDLNKSFRDQGFSEAEFDIIVALDVLHAAPRIHTSLDGLRLLLAEGGTLLAIELDGSSWSRIPGGIWHDFVFGSFSEWFGFEDERQHCALAPQEWRKILQEVGFYRIQTCTEAYGGLDFIFSAQTPNGRQYHASSDPQAAPVYLFLQYRAGEEIEIQGQLLRMDPYTRESICLVARAGSDGDAAAGLTISLIQEFELWDIRLAIFEDEHDLNDHRTLIGAYRGLYDAGERILYFPVDNKPFVRRIVPCLPNPNSQEVKSTEEPSIKIPGHNEPDILIHSRSTFGINIEVIIGTCSDSSSNGDMVAIIGAVEEWKNTRVQVASTSSIRTRSDHKAANDVLASCVAFLCLNSVGAPRILVALSNQDLSQSLHQALTALSDVNVDTSYTVFSPERRYDVIVTDSATATHFPHIRRWLTRSGNLFHWEDKIAYLLDNDANMMKATLSRSLLRVLDSKASVQAPSTEETVPLDRPRINPVTLSATSRKSLFDGAKTYLLLGGIGGLGIELALWMYRFGARHLVLSSRRGPSSVEDDELALKKLSYLRSREDLHISLRSSDATNETQLRGILSSLESPLGGVFMLTLALSDSLFVNQTPRSFQSVRDSKLAPLSILSTCVDINNLEFCIAFSSLAGVVGTAGQTNYSSACTALDGAMDQYHNAFSIAVPGILDAGYLVKTSDDYIDRTRLTAGGITSEALFSCVRDGILRIQAGMKVSSPHIPDIDWVAVSSNTDLGPLCRHLTIEADAKVRVNKTRDTHLNSTKDMLKLILELIDVPEDSFDNKQPLTSYGVDSICAARISNALRPHTSVSQMQILGGISWDQMQSIYASTSGPNENGELDIEGALAILLDVIGIQEDDFDPSVPLLSYGLDSLVASRLARALAPFLHVTALQLLAGTSWIDLMGKFHTANNAPATHQRHAPTLELPCEADLITELRGGDGIPLILIHDLMGSILALRPLKRHFTSSPIWAIQVTQGVPLDSFADLVKYYHDAIRKKQPVGPYRLASFSGTSIVCLALARMFEDAGEEVGQLGFIDHFPILWACPAYRLSDIMSNPTTAPESKYGVAIGQGLAHVAAMRRSDPYTKLAGLNEHAPASAELAAHLYEKLFIMTAGFLQEIRDGSDLIKPITTLLSRIRAPISVFVATDGIVKTLPSAIQGEWKDLGASSSHRVRVVYADKGHYGILDDEYVAKELELAWPPGIL